MAQQGRQQHIMDAQRDLAGSDGLLTTTQEEGNIRSAGTDIHDHKAAAGILGSAETEIGAEGRAFSRKGDRRDFIRSRETGLLTYLIRQGSEESSEIFPACFGHFIRNRETPEQGMGTIGTGLQGRHEHDLMQTEGNRPSFFLFPLEAGIKRLGRDGKYILKIRGHQDNTIFKR